MLRISRRLIQERLQRFNIFRCFLTSAVHRRMPSFFNHALEHRLRFPLIDPIGRCSGVICPHIFSNRCTCSRSHIPRLTSRMPRPNSAPTPHAVLKRYWGYNEFRGPQLNVIESALNGNDNLVIMATGAGKSLCMQVGSISYAWRGHCEQGSGTEHLHSDSSDGYRSYCYCGVSSGEFSTVVQETPYHCSYTAV